AGPFNASGVPCNADGVTCQAGVPPTSRSGFSDGWGGDSFVTLGLWRFDDDPSVICNTAATATNCADQTGTVNVQAGTIMHELGHNLGLLHAGTHANPQCMPNYQSVMNYVYQTRLLTNSAGTVQSVDYSNGLNANLTEGSLVENPASAVNFNYRV